jgi:hypothetical protein
MIDFIMKNKGKLIAVLCAVAGLYYGIVALVPGDQPDEKARNVEKVLNKAKEAIGEDKE